MSVKALFDEVDTTLKSKQDENLLKSEEVQKKETVLKQLAERFFYEKERITHKLAALEDVDGVDEEKLKAVREKLESEKTDIESREVKELDEVKDEIKALVDEINQIRTEVRELVAKREIYEELLNG